MVIVLPQQKLNPGLTSQCVFVRVYLHFCVYLPGLEVVVLHDGFRVRHARRRRRNPVGRRLLQLLLLSSRGGVQAAVVAAVVTADNK